MGKFLFRDRQQRALFPGIAIDGKHAVKGERLSAQAKIPRPIALKVTVET